MSLPSGSSGQDSNSLTPTGAHIIHAVVFSGASPVIPEQLLRSSQQQTTVPERTRINTQGSRVPQSSSLDVVRDEPTLHGGKSLPPHMSYYALNKSLL